MQEIIPVTLDTLLPGESGIIHGYAGARELHHRLKELGFVEGTRVRVRRCAPWGDPMELVIRGYHLSIRKEDAKCILVLKEKTACHGPQCRCRHRHGSREDL